MKLDDSKRAPLDPLSGPHLAGRPAQRLLKGDQSKAPEDSEVKAAQLHVESLDPRDRFLKRHKRSFKGLYNSKGLKGFWARIEFDSCQTEHEAQP